MKEIDLTSYVLSGSPLVYLDTMEIKSTLEKVWVDPSRECKKVTWNVIEGIYELGGSHADIDEFLDELPKLGKRILVCAELFDMAFESVNVIQKILNVLPQMKSNNVTLCVISTNPKNIPAPLEKLFAVVDVPLPTKEDFREFLKDSCESNGIEYLPEVADACVGLGYEQGENALARMLRDKKCCDMETILEAKKRIYSDTGFLKLVPFVSEDMFGGNELAVEYIKKRMTAFEPGSKKPRMKAIFLTGIQGCGKSLLAKILGYYFKCPVVFADLGAMKGGLVGETEKNTRTATKIADASGKIILCFDEAEKGLAGSSDGGHDSGASAGQLGHLLTWTQERNSEAIVVFTSNNPSILPPEMMRAGRWDALFFFSFPNKKARRDILEIQKKKHELSELTVTDALVDLTENMTGVELEQFVIESHFVDNPNDLETQKRTISEIPKVYWTKRREVQKILEYGTCLRQASMPDPVESKLAPREVKRNIDIDTPVSVDDLKAKIKEKML